MSHPRVPEILNLVTLLNKSSFLDWSVWFILYIWRWSYTLGIVHQRIGLSCMPPMILVLCYSTSNSLWKVYGSLFPSSLFSMEILRVLNAAPSQLFPNSLAYIKVFEMVDEDLVITPIMGFFFSLYDTNLMKGSWVTLSSQSGRGLFLSHSNHYKYWKDMFARVMGEIILSGCYELMTPSFFHCPGWAIL